MGKRKNFKNNPVLQFISTEHIEHEDYIDNNDHIDSLQHTDIDVKINHMEHMKDTYVTNAKMDQNSIPNNSNSKEIKNKRLTVLLKPSIFENAAKLSGLKRTSVNNTINKALEEYIQKHEEILKKYDILFGNE